MQVEPAWLHFGSTFATVALLAGYEHGEAWLDAARWHVRDNVAHLTHALNDANVGVRALPLQATYLVWLDCTGLVERYHLQGAEALEGFMLAAGLVLSPGREFDPTGASDAFMRLNAACPRDVLDEAVSRLRLAVLSTERPKTCLRSKCLRVPPDV